MLRAGVDLELAVHRVAHLGLRQHAADGLFHQAHRLALAEIDGALFPQTAFVPAVLTIQLLIFLPPGQLDRPGIDDDDVIARIDEGGLRRLVLTLK